MVPAVSLLAVTYLGAMPEPCFRIEATLNQSELTRPNSLSTESLELLGYRNMLEHMREAGGPESLTWALCPSPVA